MEAKSRVRRAARQIRRPTLDASYAPGGGDDGEPNHAQLLGATSFIAAAGALGHRRAVSCL
jgi:hypothetical protein